MTLTIVGLGPGDPLQLTREAWQLLTSADEIALRTRSHPVIQTLPHSVRLHSFDHVSEQSQQYDEVYKTIVSQVLSLAARPQGIIYAVPGHPTIGESTVARILREASRNRLSVRLVPGISVVDTVCAALSVEPLGSGLQMVDAMEVAARQHPPLQADHPAILGQLFSRELACDVKDRLLSLYPGEHIVTVTQRLGLPDEQVAELPLHQLDRTNGFDYMTALYVPPLPAPASYASFQEIVAQLRAPAGCSWDRAQTHLSLRRDLLEETYEVLEALDSEDVASLQEELGDLLLHVAMHIQIASEAGEFRLPDVIAAIGNKLIRRHPHVFGDAIVKNEAELLRNWEAVKQKERADNGASASMLDGVPTALPALAQAQGFLERARRYGLAMDEWQREAVQELLLTLSGNEAVDLNLVGRGVFALVALAAMRSIDLESALRTENMAFARRVASAEAAAQQRGQELAQMSPEEQAGLWETLHPQPDGSAI